jgi:hypothetical protein
MIIELRLPNTETVVKLCQLVFGELNCLLPFIKIPESKTLVLH